jgi:hypothetical protein
LAFGIAHHLCHVGRLCQVIHWSSH